MAGYTKKQLEDIIASLNGKLESMERKLDALEGLPGTVAKLESMVEASYAENNILKVSLEYKEKQIDALELKINSLEQYNRSWSIRVNGLVLTSEEEKCMETVKRKVYNCLLLPILNGAVDNGDLEEVPNSRQPPGERSRAPLQRQSETRHRALLCAQYEGVNVPPQEGVRTKGRSHHS